MTKFGVVFSGGLAKGAYQFGFLDAMSKHINKSEISAFSASSIGVYNAYAFLADKMDLGRDFWLNFDCINQYELFNKVVLDSFLKKLTREMISTKDHFSIPLYISSTSIFPFLRHRYYKIYGNHYKYWNSLILTSVGFPIITGLPKMWRGKFHIDGGVIDNIPVLPLLVEDCDVIFVIHFDSKYKLEKRWESFGKIIFEIDLSVSNRFYKQSFNFSKEALTTMYNSGKEYGEAFFERIFLKGKEDLSYIDETFKSIMYEEHVERKKYITWDRLVSLLNRRFKRIRKKPHKYIVDLTANSRKTEAKKEAKRAKRDLKINAKRCLQEKM